MVMGAEHRTSKNGNLYGSMELEDFTDNYRLTLWSDEYLKFKHMMVEGTQVYIQARVDAARNNPNRLDIRITKMILLADLMEKLAKKMVLDIPLENLDENNLAKILDTIKANPGKCDIMVKIRDTNEGISLDMFPRKLRVNPAAVTRVLRNDEFLEIWLNGNKLARENSEKDTSIME
jgi:DNA polymerase-3 subunit alpha